MSETTHMCNSCDVEHPLGERCAFVSDLPTLRAAADRLAQIEALLKGARYPCDIRDQDVCGDCRRLFLLDVIAVIDGTPLQPVRGAGEEG